MDKIITNITIGNWYLVREKPTRISPANVVWAFRDGCFPIPLTSEILENSGIHREGGASFWHDEYYSIVFFFWNEERIELIISKRGDDRPYIAKLDVKYVDQLQDLLRVYNINLMIEL